jgi:hypothetical protein
MKKITLLAFFSLFIMVNGCKKQENLTPVLVPDPSSLDDFIVEKLNSDGKFEWSSASDDQIWTALANADHVLSVGYQPAGETGVLDKIHTINIRDEQWANARQQVIGIILTHERALNPTLRANDLFAFVENGVLPYFEVYVKNPATISALRRSPMVRYAEPIGYEPYMTTHSEQRSGSGCDSNTSQTDLVEGIDYVTIDPDTKRSWNHPYHKIQEAWANSTGSGCKIAILDTGCSDAQENLGADFNQGFSSGRSIGKFVTIPGQSTVNDECGHGTSMLGAAMAPRGEDGAATGIAYNANASSYRAAFDVYLNQSSEVSGVSTAFTNAGNDNSVKIISMSMGRMTSLQQRQNDFLRSRHFFLVDFVVLWRYLSCQPITSNSSNRYARQPDIQMWKLP